jgi:hypothetical protein
VPCPDREKVAVVAAKAATRWSKVIVRVFIAHGLAYPIAFGWAVASIPLLIVYVVSKVGTALDVQVVGHRVLVDVSVPAGVAFVLAHLAGLQWGLARDQESGRRKFLLAMAFLGGVPVVVGGASWIWLIVR